MSVKIVEQLPALVVQDVEAVIYRPEFSCLIARFRLGETMVSIVIDETKVPADFRRASASLSDKPTGARKN
jgi:hypothetical protein